ncbi:MAG: tetratricopeptide repeat protein [Oscillospiraceae bacterium]|nr:tetratricopeptide repeat protein [Oscillospiraceae bacterium]
MSKRTKHLLAAVLVLLLLALGGLVGWRLWKDKQYNEALQTAIEYREAGRYWEARDLYLSLELRTEAAECEAMRIQQEMENAYAAAETLLDSGSFLDAKDAFLALGDFEDAAMRAQECDYRRAEKYVQNDRLSEAIALLESMSNYPGAEELLNNCRDTLYDRAVEATYACRLDEAVQRWNELGDYRDSMKLKQRCLDRIVTMAEGTDEPVNYSEYAGTDLGKGILYYHRLGLIYVPKDAGPETGCMIFYPGGYDEALANNYLTEYVYAPDPPNAIMLLCYANGYGHVSDKVEDSYRALEQAAIENNVFLHDLVLCGASMGAYTACQGAAILYEKHGLAAKRVLTFDAGMHWEVESHVMTPEQCDSTARAGTQFYLLEFGGVGMNKRAIELMVVHGNDVTIVECAGGGHYGIITDAIEYGMIDWALGRGDRPVNSNYKYYPLDRNSTYPFGVG